MSKQNYRDAHHNFWDKLKVSSETFLKRELQNFCSWELKRWLIFGYSKEKEEILTEKVVVYARDQKEGALFHELS